ncbi:hypothetical protein B0H66DRAFT_540416 [Apodospora peruviana]|uniref:Peptidase S8/S53 domain-containing protein n=1 Tax=Apodospora peruviana TaxID=516989 RepID=A0AAE0IQA1_9PEZI|nr:hypothetical protein B0H66DRAFT_540416 [Apodospora peruviana]
MAKQEPPLNSFAVGVVEKFIGLSSELAKEDEQVIFYKSFSAELFVAQQWLLAQPIPFELPTAARVTKLLDNLERLSKWPPSLQPEAQKSKSRLFASKVRTQKYQQLSQLLVNPIRTKQCLRHFAKKEPHHQHQALISTLRRFPKWKQVPGSRENATVASAKGQSTSQDSMMADSTYYAKTLYKVLSEHSACSIHGANGKILPHLRLSARRDTVAGTHEPFTVFFLDHPHYNTKSETCCQWQQTQIDVHRTVVAFSDETPTISADQVFKVIRRGSLCGIISNRQNVQLCLTLSNGELVQREPRPHGSSFILHTPNVPLSQLLESKQLSRKMRLLLCYLLAKAVWQFYNSDWMDREWTKENINFMFEHRHGGLSGIFVNEPFLRAKFDDKLNDDQAAYQVHKFPKVLALGIMLLEIELGLDIATNRRPDSFSVDGQLTVNGDLIAANHLLQDQKLWTSQDTFPGLKTVVGRCIDPSCNLFDDFRHDTQGQRDVLQKQIVFPLQELLKNSWGDPEEISLRPVDKIPLVPHIQPSITSSSPIGTQAVHAPSATPPTHLQGLNHDTQIAGLQPQIPNLRITDELNANTHSSQPLMTKSSTPDCQSWFDELDKLNSVLRAPKKKLSKYPAVRVAILDTGVKEEMGDHIEQYKDFVGQDDENLEDLTGHGTTTAQLVLKLFNKAELFIARVFETNDIETSQSAVSPQDLIASAIRHAIDEWNVDIIVLACGFEADHDRMRDEIMRARANRVLVFAAASNYSGMRRVAFPGRMHADVMCMFSTHAGNKHSGFNPSPVPNRRNFAVLGEEVRLHEKGELLSGTSISTAIGAGLAARLLDFSRHPDCRDRIRGVDDLRLVEGMSAVFALMAEGGEDNGYNCVAPWRILEDVEDDESREKKREYICETLSRALKAKHRR